MKLYILFFLMVFSEFIFANEKSSLKICWISYRSDQYFQVDWMKYLFSEFEVITKFDPNLEYIEPGCVIVISDKLNSEQLNTLKNFKESGGCFGMFHLGDETYQASTEAYQYAAFVFREYNKPELSLKMNHIFYLPLGCKPGFILDEPYEKLPNLESRPYIWGFAGQVNKSNREEMFHQMKSLNIPFFHYFNSGFNSSDCLMTNEYQNILQKILFAPCPRGWVNLDSFRLYEALESGCIPIVERGEDLYFLKAYIDPPFIVVDSWKNAKIKIEELLKDPIAIENLRYKCYKWWKNQKINLKNKIKEQILKMSSN